METINTLTPGKAILFYDGRCPLCLREMARLDVLKSDQLQLADIHAVTPLGDLPDRDTLLRTLHLRQADGSWLTGADANVAAWQYTGRGAWFRWMRWPLLRRPVDMVYAAWARWRYKRLYANSCSLREEP